MAERRAYDPAKHGSARVFRGDLAEARVAGSVDGHEGNPRRPYESFSSDEARAIYREAYLEHMPKNGQLGLFSAREA